MASVTARLALAVELVLGVACTRTEAPTAGANSSHSEPAANVTIPSATATARPASVDHEVHSLEAFSRRVRTALAERDIATFAALVHPEKGVRFSPYAHVDPNADVVLSSDELRRIGTADKTRVWGSFDGSGDPIRMTFREYFERFVLIPSLAEAQQAVDRSLGSGNTVNNIQQAYPGASFLELHHPGSDPKYDGMDWQSVRVVFERRRGRFYIVGIVHDQWTI